MMEKKTSDKSVYEKPILKKHSQLKEVTLTSTNTRPPAVSPS